MDYRTKVGWIMYDLCENFMNLGIDPDSVVSWHQLRQLAGGIATGHQIIAEKAYQEGRTVTLADVEIEHQSKVRVSELVAYIETSAGKEVREHIKEGKLINGIKELRERTQCSLKDGKNACQAWRDKWVG